MMKAVVCTKYRSPDMLGLQQVNKPVPRENEVLVRIHAATATATALGARTGKPVFARLFSGLTKPTDSIRMALPKSIIGVISMVPVESVLYRAVTVDW